MKILITNDDGIDSLGIKALVGEIKGIADVIVVAPDREKSASGHSITISSPLRINKFYRNNLFFGYAVNGTPVDCVKLAVKVISKEKPDMLISGINLGPNTGTHIIYSGTVAAAVEAAVLGIPSFAVSLAIFNNPDYRFSSLFAKRLALSIKKSGLPDGISLNVNIPAVREDEIKGVRLTVQGKTKFVGSVKKRVDTRGLPYYWLSPDIVEDRGNSDLDTTAIQNKEVSITPLGFDMSDRKSLDKLKGWDIFSLNEIK